MQRLLGGGEEHGTLSLTAEKKNWLGHPWTLDERKEAEERKDVFKILSRSLFIQKTGWISSLRTGALLGAVISRVISRGKVVVIEMRG